MTEKEFTQKMRREVLAGVAMHALLLSDSTGGETTPEMATGIADQAFAIADAMIAKGGPIE